MKYYTEIAVEAATLAGQALLGKFRKQHASVYGAEILSVGNRSLSKEVTSANDHEANSLIIEVLRKRCPTHNILTEETGLLDNGSPYTWIVDPLDGSSNFLNHNPFFAVSVCLTHHDEPITGVILAPFIEEMLVARKGQGCTLNGRRVHVSSTEQLSRTYIVGCPGGEKNNIRFSRLDYALQQQIKDFRKIGSAAIECCMVAAGRVDGFTTLSIDPWDVAAGVLAVQEAGGRVTDFYGEPWKLNKTDLLISNGRVHDVILAELDCAGIIEQSGLKLEVEIGG